MSFRWIAVRNILWGRQMIWDSSQKVWLYISTFFLLWWFSQEQFVNAFMSSAKLLTSAKCKPVFSWSVTVLKNPPATLVYNLMSKSSCIGPHSPEGQNFRLVDYKDKGKQSTSKWMKLFGNWNESKFGNNQICERPFLALWAVWTGEI